MRDPRRLELLASKNDKRKAVFALRKQREKSRFRSMVCTACGGKEGSCRDVTDVCDDCLVDMWNAEDIIAGEYRRARRGGVRPVWLTNIFHWIGYAHLEGGSEDAPEPFGRGRSGDTLNTLYVELFEALAQALPADPKTIDGDVEPLLPMQTSRWSRGDDHCVIAMLPEKAADALRNIWMFVRWHSKLAYASGYDDGHRLIREMALGNITGEEFTKDVLRQTESAQEQMRKIAKNAAERR